MTISLCEDDGIFFGGKPRNVVLSIVFDDGRKLRVPYSADKSISEMYEDLGKINENKKIVIKNIFSDYAVAIADSSIRTIENKVTESLANKNNTIEKEDIVKCIKVEDRGKGATVDIVVGGEYRVIKITKQNGMITSYDVVDDTADTRRRIYVMPHEVEFLRKRVAPVFKEIGSPEEIFPCGICKKPIACVKSDDGMFRGVCEDCNKEIMSVNVRQVVET